MVRRCGQNQFDIMIGYMERNGDLNKPLQGVETRLDSMRKWNELTTLLNNAEGEGEARSVEKWRKVWSDLKNNTKKKLEKITKRNGTCELTNNEKRVIDLMRLCKSNKTTYLVVTEDGNVLKKEIDDSCQRSISPPSQLCSSVDGQPTETESRDSTPCSSNASIPPLKRRRIEEIKDKTDKYIEFEKEREKLNHEREMARIRQNDQIITYLGRVINVIETLAPSVQRYLDRK